MLLELKTIIILTWELGVGVGTNTGGASEEGAYIDIGDISLGYETELLDSYDGDFDEPIRRKKYPRHNEADMSSIAEFKEVIKEHALLNGRNIRYVKNDQVRCRVRYKDLGGECPWMTFASKVKKFGCVRLKTWKSKHICGRNYSASSNWIAKKITNNLSRGKDMKLGTVHRARIKTREIVHEKAVQQYEKFDYVLIFSKNNPGFGSSPQLSTVPEGSAPASQGSISASQGDVAED
ncbi:hypothetical protein Ahy_B07g086746 [Arachis hypogaea]|uniref:Uncharacterized protein n=1 Tax=Arachis hypogaea TaxID=3818 RepID=A0A444YAR9_ARAHY|nr:hypothetical protein Ahy_B07g086746 [Arachis hypogaea]